MCDVVSELTSCLLLNKVGKFFWDNGLALVYYSKQAQPLIRPLFFIKKVEYLHMATRVGVTLLLGSVDIVTEWVLAVLEGGEFKPDLERAV